MELTLERLKELRACKSGIEWFSNQKSKDVREIALALVEDNHFDYARWLLVHLMTHPQQILWAISSAEKVLNVFELKYPNDLRPRKAIQAAKDFLDGKISTNTVNAAYAAAYAANAATTGAAACAANAAYAAAYAAYAANADDAVDAAACAANVANAADATCAGDVTINEIIQSGLNILGC